MRSSRRIAYIAVTLLGAVSLGVGALFVADLYVHQRVQNAAGVNRWGYRGPVVGRKQPNEIRVVVLGGSTAFGYGLPYTQAFPFYLEQKLNQPPTTGTRYRVINLGGLSQGAYAFRFDLADYAYLQYDAAILYEGYNDLGVRDLPPLVPRRNTPNYLLWRRQSPLFRMAGYFPVLPLALREKALLLQAGGDLNRAYSGRVTFRPGLATRTTAAAMEHAAAIAERLGFEYGSFSGGEPAKLPHDAEENPDLISWRHYTSSVVTAVAFARERGARVLVVGQPYASKTHVSQQRALAETIASRFREDRGVRYVDLGTVVDLRDRRIVYDGLHLVAEGNDRIASHLIDPLHELLSKGSADQ